MRTETHDRSTTRIGIVGLGHAGSIHLEALRGVRAAEVAAVCDARVDARRRAEAAGIPAYASLDAMLERTPLHGVVVCTPPAEHAAISTRCLARGLHVLCEKPLALTTGDVLTMLQMAKRAQRQLVVASKFRHLPEIGRVRTLLSAGEIGEPVWFEISFCSSIDMRERWNAQQPLSGGGVIIDNGCHAFDIVSFLFGGIHGVHATRLKPLAGIAVEDSATLQVWADHGVIGRVDLSWSLAPPRDSYLVVHGSGGSIEIGWRRARLRRVGERWRAIGGAYDKIGAHRAMHERFVASIEQGSAAWISAAECLQAVAAVESAYRSLESGATEWVVIPGVRDLDLIAVDAPLAAASH